MLRLGFCMDGEGLVLFSKILIGAIVVHLIYLFNLVVGIGYQFPDTGQSLLLLVGLLMWDQHCREMIPCLK